MRDGDLFHLQKAGSCTTERQISLRTFENSREYVQQTTRKESVPHLQAKARIGVLPPQSWSVRTGKGLEVVTYYRRHRKDTNHDSLKAVFEAMGCSVANLSQCGNGIPDLAVSLHGATEYVEIKSPGGELTPEQKRFHRETKGIVHQAITVNDVIRIVKQLKQRMKTR